MHRRGGSRGEAKTLEHSCENQLRLHHRQWLTDADARPSAERKVSEARPLLVRAIAPALGLEHLRLREKFRVSVDDPLAHQKHGAPPEAISADLDLADRLPPQQVDGRIEPHRLS
jgi:hypothetical protein